MTAKPTELEVHPIVKQIIDRDCHVGNSYRAVIRHVVSKLRDGWKTFREMPRPDRRMLMRECIQQHRANRELYRAVMYPSYKTSADKKGATMDPDVCFSMILASIASEEWIGAAQHAENLREWFAKGGFPPGGGKLRQSSIDDLLEWLIRHPERHP